MSTWNDDKHEAARFLASERAAFGPNTKDRLSDALDEIERLRALTTITDDMVAAARETMDDHWAIPLPYSWACECGMTVKGTDGHAQAVILSHIARTGLEAALKTKENEA